MEASLLTMQWIPRAWAEAHGWNAAALVAGGEPDAACAWRNYAPPAGYPALIGARLASVPSGDSSLLCYRGAGIDLQVWTHRASIEALSVRVARGADLGLLADLACALDLVAFLPHQRLILPVARLTEPTAPTASSASIVSA